MLSDSVKETILRLKDLEWTWERIGIAVDEKPRTCRGFYSRWKAMKDLPPKLAERAVSLTKRLGLHQIKVQLLVLL